MKVKDLKKITPWQELKVIERSKELRHVYHDLADSIEHLPALRETDGKDATCTLHYFDIRGAADWYIFEVDQKTGEAFGFATLSGEFDDPYAEFGYIDLLDLCKSARINLDLHFAGITKSEIKRRRYDAKAKKSNEAETVKPAATRQAEQKAPKPKGSKPNTKWQWNRAGTKQVMICNW